MRQVKGYLAKSPLVKLPGKSTNIDKSRQPRAKQRVKYRHQARKLKLSLSMVLLASIAHAQALPDAPPPHTFINKTSLALMGGEVLARSLDAQSTRANLTNPCKCYRETSIGGIAGSNGRMWAYSMGMAGVVITSSYVAHKLGWHKLERLPMMVDIALDGRSAMHNYAIAGQQAKPGASVVVDGGKVASR